MATREGLLTADDLLRMPDDDLWHELHEGRLITMSPPGFGHGVCANRLATALTNYVRAHGLGLVAPQDTGFKLKSSPDTVRAPDVAFVSRGRVPPGELPERYWDGAPDLAVEVVSPGERRRDVEKKVQEYLACGARAVWVVRPRARTVSLHHPFTTPIVLAEPARLEDAAALPGFSYPLSELFEDLARGRHARSR
jgi:Uma2 family endonuclease